MTDQMPAWQADALCRDQPYEIFFPTRGGDVREAKAICSKCSVQGPCLEWAIDIGEKHGVWGGLSERERRRVRRRRRDRIQKVCAGCGADANHRPETALTCGAQTCNDRIRYLVTKSRGSGVPYLTLIEDDDYEEEFDEEEVAHPAAAG